MDVPLSIFGLVEGLGWPHLLSWRSRLKAGPLLLHARQMLILIKNRVHPISASVMRRYYLHLSSFIPCDMYRYSELKSHIITFITNQFAVHPRRQRQRPLFILFYKGGKQCDFSNRFTDHARYINSILSSPVRRAVETARKRWFELQDEVNRC